MENWEYGRLCNYSGEESEAIKWDELTYFPRQKFLLESMYKSVEDEMLPELEMRIEPLAIISGPPRSGKSTLIRSFASSHDLDLYIVSSSKILTGTFAETAQRLVDMFQSIREKDGPLILHFDGLEFIAWERLDPSETSGFKRLVAVFLNELKDLLSTDNRVIITAETEMPELVDSAVRARAINIKIELSIPEVRRNIWEDIYDRIKESVPGTSWDIESIVAATDGIQLGQIHTMVMLGIQEYVANQMDRYSTDLLLKQMDDLVRFDKDSLTSNDINLKELGKLLDPYYRQGG